MKGLEKKVNSYLIQMLVLGMTLSLVVVSLGSEKAVSPDVSKELKIARQLLAKSQVQRALEYVDASDEETVREWLSLCNAYGPQGDEIYRSRLLYKLFRIYGLERVHIDSERNVIGVRPGVGDGPTVVLNAHIDAVKLWPKDQPIEAFVADGRVWAPSAGDDLAGVTQMLTVLRALNAANIETEGDLWFVGLTGEEEYQTGAAQLVRGNYPHNIDWRNGDILVYFHGGGGEGVSTGSHPYNHMAQLRVFVPIGWNRWRTDAVEALVKIVDRINKELRDPRVSSVSSYDSELTTDLLFLNMAMIQGSAIDNGVTTEAWVRFDLRSPSESRLLQADADIQRIAAEVCEEMGEGYTYHYDLYMKLGTEGIDGWDKVNNAPARMAAAAAQALYGVTPVIDPTSGGADCSRAYEFGMPGMTFRGNVIDHGGGKFEVRTQRGELKSPVRRKSAGHDVTESAEINRLWSGIKQGLLFVVSYARLAQ